MNIKSTFVFAGILFAANTPSAQQPATQQTQGQMADQQRLEREQRQIQRQMEQPSQPVEKGTGPITEKELIKILKSRAAPDAIIETIKQRSVAFDLTPEIEAKLRKAKATDQVIGAILNAGPTARTTKMISAGLWSQPDHPVSSEEGEAFIAVWNEHDPEKAIPAGIDFMQKWPKSSLVTYAYAAQANAYSEKGDAEKAVEVAKKGLDLDPNNLQALLVLTRILPQPRYLVAHEKEQDKIVSEAENYANHALQELAKQAKPQTGGPDQEMKGRMAIYLSDFHAALGMVHLDRATSGLTGSDKAELAKAEQEFDMAVTATDHPSPIHYFRRAETYELDGKLENALASFTKASELGQGTRVKTMADQRIEELKKQRAAQPAKLQ